MHLRDVTRYDVVEMAWKALPHSNEGHAVVVVDVRDGNVEVLFRTKDFEDWAKNSFDHKKVIFDLKEEAANHDVGILYKKYRHEVCCRILEIKEIYPHLI